MATPQRIGPYAIEARLGAGGMGTVYRARHGETGAAVALKVLAAGADPELRARFQREGEAHARVGAHPHVVSIHAAGQDGERVYLAMDLVAGGDLLERLRGGPLAAEEAAAIGRDLAQGLAHLHARGVLHRDLKPANVLFAEDGRALLADFGLARLAGAASLTETGAVLGTPAYMAPEQAHGEEEEPRTDVYGLGAILYHLLSGAPPFQGGSSLAILAKVSSERPTPLRRARPEVPRPLEAVVARAMDPDPQRRHPSAAALAEELDAFLRGELHMQRRAGGAAALAAGALGLTGVAVALAVRQPVPEAARAPSASSPASSAAAAPAPTRSASASPSPAPTPRQPLKKWELETKLSKANDLAEKRPQRALQLVDEVLAGLAPDDPRRSNALNVKAEIYRGVKDLPQRLRALDEALRLDPRHLGARLKRARCRFRVGDARGALADCDAGLGQGVRGGLARDFYLTRAEAYLLLGPSNLARAWRATEAGLRCGTSFWLLALRIRLAVLANRPCLALRGVEALRRLGSDRLARVAGWRGLAHLALGDVWTAREERKRVLEKDSWGKPQRLLDARLKTVGVKFFVEPREAVLRSSDPSLHPAQRVASLTRAASLPDLLTAGLLVQRAKLLSGLARPRLLDACDDLRWAVERGRRIPKEKRFVAEAQALLARIPAEVKRAADWR